MMQEQFEPGGSRLEARGNRWLEAYARLAPGKSREEAAAELTVLSARIAEENERESLGRRVALVPAVAGSPQRRAVLGPVILLLAAISAIVLILACANLASLLLARGVGRRREIAIRLSLGASRGQVVRQLLAESLLLSLVGGVSGVLVASASVGPARGLGPGHGVPGRARRAPRRVGRRVRRRCRAPHHSRVRSRTGTPLGARRDGGALRDESAGVVRRTRPQPPAQRPRGGPGRPLGPAPGRRRALPPHAPAPAVGRPRLRAAGRARGLDGAVHQRLRSGARPRLLPQSARRGPRPPRRRGGQPGPTRASRLRRDELDQLRRRGLRGPEGPGRLGLLQQRRPRLLRAHEDRPPQGPRPHGRGPRGRPCGRRGQRGDGGTVLAGQRRAGRALPPGRALDRASWAWPATPPIGSSARSRPPGSSSPSTRAIAPT